MSTTVVVFITHSLEHDTAFFISLKVFESPLSI